MKNILFLVLLISVHYAKAFNYYFSSTSGDDLRTSLQARNPATPWRSLDKLNTIFSSLKPGDFILLKRGETFFGSINVNKSGTSNLPIVIGAYGFGKKPVISGFTLLSWNSLKNNLYESNALNANYINVLTINNVLTRMGRYPDNGYMTIGSHNGTSSITDDHLLSAPNWTGADLIMRTRRWVTDRDLITNHTGNVITYAASSKYEPKENYGYFIQNSPLTLDKQGEWYYNPSSKKIWLYSTYEPKKVNVATLDNLITFSNNSYVNIDNLIIEGCSKNAININFGSNIHITNCDISFSGQNGVNVNKHLNFLIENCTIENSVNNGIDLGTNSSYAIVQNNIIRNTSVIEGMSRSGDQNSIAIFTKSRNSLIKYNKIINTGYTAVYFAGDSALIENNFIDTFCTVKDDGGGIYSYNGSASVVRKGRKVIGNIILNGIGAPEGTDNIKKSEATGIYLDNNTTDVEITGNTISNCNHYGIYIHNASRLTVVKNTLYNNRRQLNIIQEPGNNLVRDNIITQNILFSKFPTQLISYFKSGANDIDLFGRFDNNYYAKPIGNKLVKYNNHLNNGNSNNNQDSELQGWKQTFGENEPSNRNAASSSRPSNPDYKLRFEYNPSKFNKTFSLDGAYVDINNKRYSKNIILEPYTSAVLIKE